MESMTVENIPENLFETCIERDLNAFCIREADSKKIIFGASETTLNGLHENSFVFSPFEDSSMIKSIPIDFGINEINNAKCSEKESKNTDVKFKNHVTTTQEEHEGNVKKIIRILEKNGGGKIVLSRVVIKKGDLNLTSLFKELCNKYPESTVFWFYTPATSSYCGATPELLLEGNDNVFKSMSLAGTRLVAEEKQQEPWDSKNIEEQGIVTSFIKELFLKHGFETTVSKPFNRRAGKIEHICNIIEGKFKENEVDLLMISHLLSSLSPTPALSGYPQELALDAIRELEKHHRGYYGGFFGFFSNIHNFKIYVTLRCLQYLNGTSVLFAGGGITRFSHPAKEWEETENKLQSILPAFLKNLNVKSI